MQKEISQTKQRAYNRAQERLQMDKKFLEAFTESLRRYVTALDSSDLHSGFASLWGALEAATDTFKEPIVKRALKVCRSSENVYFKHILNSFRYHRNSAVHANSGIPNSEVRIYRLKKIVEESILFILRNHHRFKSFEEYVRYLDLPNDPSEIESRIDLLDFAMERHKGGNARRKK